jgi:hypothetical protein
LYQVLALNSATKPPFKRLLHKDKADLSFMYFANNVKGAARLKSPGSIKWQPNIYWLICCEQLFWVCGYIIY